MRSELVSSAQRKDDVRGILNYARDFLRILLIQVSLINERIVYLGSLRASPNNVPNRPNSSKAEIRACDCSTPQQCECYFVDRN